MSEMSICKEWNEKRMRHPFFAENLSESTVSKCWEASSRNYSMPNYMRIRDNIVSEIKDSGIFENGRTMLDIGCGPGTYAILFSPYLQSIECLDASHGMLSRLLEECDKNNLDNITTTFADWNAYVPSKERDIAFTSLCPPTNTPESILKMEACARQKCIYVSSASKDSKISKELWKKLGKDYSFEGYNTNYPFQFLKEIGRSPELKMFTDKVVIIDRPLEDVIEDEIRRLTSYMDITDDVRNIVRNVYTDHSQDSRIFVESEVRAGLLIWSPLN